MEKRKPTYDLASIKAEFSTVDGLRMTLSARTSAFALGLNLGDIVTLIPTIVRRHFFKSMTSYASSQIWQDVYHVPYAEYVLYIKFTIDQNGHLIISLKEK